jgi:malate dehydrogenase (oxaloacetate-decarboxylating)(NADP+)
MTTRKEALDYHQGRRPGKIEIRCTKPTATQRDLSLAYTPGVAEPCLEIAKEPSASELYTARGNLVAVISNGTAVLGLGNLGPRASKPVMEGKAVLFKRFADIDVFDIEVDATTVEEFVEVVSRLEPTFGGINIEDVKAPECFEIEEQLVKRMDIPVFHDDQHGTAIISGAALVNAVELANKRREDCRIVINGAGASAIACAQIYEALGFRHENIRLCDSKGPIYAGRAWLNQYKELYAHPDDGSRTLEELARDVDVLVGLSVKGAFSPEMVLGMARDPIVFAMANPTPEIMPDEARAVRPDLIIGTGRSDFANQINNVLGFPFIFRGALDSHARRITMEMKVAASHALASLAKEDVPESVSRAYGGERFRFGREYLIPKPFDPRVLIWESHAVAKAAIECGSARKRLDLDHYREELAQRLDPTRTFVALATRAARTSRPTVVFPEALNERVLRAVQSIGEEKIARVVLLGNAETVAVRATSLDVDLDGAEVIEPRSLAQLDRMVEAFQGTALGRGKAFDVARKELLADPLLCGLMLLEVEGVDALIAGTETAYPQAARKLLRVLGRDEGYPRAAGMHLVRLRDRTLFFADTTLNTDPDAETLAGIAISAARAARRFESEPVVAMLSFANFGESDDPEARKVAEATRIVKAREPNLPVIGEIQADWAVSPGDFADLIPREQDLGRPANVLVFPNLSAANIAFRLVRALGDGEVVGPVMLGLRRAVGLLPRGATVKEIVRMTALVGLDAIRR